MQVEQLYSVRSRRITKPIEVEKFIEEQNNAGMVMITDNNSLAGLEQSQMDMEFRDEYEYPQIDLRRGTIKALPSDAGGESRRGTIREFNNELSEARSPFGLQLQKLETESNTPTPFADFINVGTL